MTKVTYEESQQLLRAPFKDGVAARGLSGLQVGQSIQYRTYPNDPDYCEVLTYINGNKVLFTEVWDVVAGLDREGNPE